jgi:hypothetical protein
MKPMKAPMATPELKVMLLERAPIIAVTAQMTAANPTPIQKMEGIDPAAYRTAPTEEFVGDPGTKR